MAKPFLDWSQKMTRALPLLLLSVCLAGCGRSTVATATQASETEFQLGHQAFERKEYDEAVKQFDSALGRGGMNADMAGEALLMRGRSLTNLGRLDDALRDLDEARKGPVPVDAVLAAKGEIALIQGDLDRARSLFTKARNLNPSIPWPDNLK
jgi:tetratricopeptide (TPR) repeat protein